MRICLFTPNFLPQVGGAEFVADHLCRQFVAMGHEPIVLAQGRPHKLDVPYTVRWYPKPFSPRWFPERTAGALAALHAEKPLDIVLCNYANPTGYGAVRFGERVGLPVILGPQGGDLYLSSNDRKRPHLWRRTVYAYRHADGLVAISSYMEGLIRGVCPNPARLELIPNGINVDAYRPPAPRPADFTDPRPFILCLGNLGPMKGFADAITAFADLRNAGHLDGTTLVIVGKGPLGEELVRHAQKVAKPDEVIFCGQRIGDEKRWFLHNCLFGLMPSLEEGLPIVGLEFLASGKPLIGSLNPAFDGICEEGVNALRVPAENPPALARAILRMNGSDLAAMGRASLKRVADYDWPQIARRYLTLMEGLVLARRPESVPHG